MTEDSSLQLTSKLIKYCTKIISRVPDIFYGDDSINELICPFCENPVAIETRICGKCGIGIPDFDSPESSDESVEENDNKNSDIIAIDWLLWVGEELPPNTKIAIIAKTENLSLYNTTDYISAFRSRGNAYYNAGEYDKALRDFDEIIRFKLFAIKKLFPYYEEKKDLSSIEGLKRSVLPNIAFDYVRRGVVYSKLKQFHKAIENFEEAVFLHCDTALLNRSMSGSYNSWNSEGQFKRVLVDITKIIESESKNGLAYASRGFCRYYNYSFGSREAEINNAMDDLAKAISLEPDIVFAYNTLANIFRDQHRYDEALEALNKAIVIDPKHASSYY